jgi:hypothetical protein
VESERVVGHPAAARQLSGSASFSESRSGKIGHISFGVKQTRKPSAGNLHAGFDEAGTGNQFTVRLLRHSQRKRRDTARPHLRSMAPVLDPTSRFVVSHPSQKARRMGHPAPGDWLHYLPRTRNAPFHARRVGNAGGRLYGKPHTVQRAGQRSASGAAGKLPPVLTWGLEARRCLFT